MPKTDCGKLSEKVLKIDAFGRPFQFVLPNGSKSYKSLSGAILTIILALLVALYAIYKFELLYKNEYELKVTTQDSSLDVDNYSSSENGFNIAIGLLNQDKVLIEDNYEQYGLFTISMLYICSPSSCALKSAKSRSMPSLPMIKA